MTSADVEQRLESAPKRYRTERRGEHLDVARRQSHGRPIAGGRPLAHLGPQDEVGRAANGNHRTIGHVGTSHEMAPLRITCTPFDVELRVEFVRRQPRATLGHNRLPVGVILRRAALGSGANRRCNA